MDYGQYDTGAFSNRGRGRGWDHERGMSTNAANYLDEGGMTLTDWRKWAAKKGFRFTMKEVEEINFDGTWHHVANANGAKRRVRFADELLCPGIGGSEREVLTELLERIELVSKYR